MKFIIIGCGVFGLGEILWLIFGYCLVLASLAPLNMIPPILKESSFLLITFCSFSFVILIVY